MVKASNKRVKIKLFLEGDLYSVEFINWDWRFKFGKDVGKC